MAAWAGIVALRGAASASIADFDGLTEGDLGPSFTTGGITFYDLDDRAGGFPVSFACEQADGTLSGPGFSPPNTLGFGAWAPGPDAVLSQVGSFWFTTGAVETFASVDVFEWLSPAGNTITLEAFSEGVLVRSVSVEIPGNGQLNHWTLSVSGVPFDSLRVNGSGPGAKGTFIGLVDNVVVVPAPASALWVVLVGSLRRGRSRPRRR
jgi:hypothetical protein